MNTPRRDWQRRARVEVCPCRRCPGWYALVWERDSARQRDYIYQVIFAQTAQEADMYGRLWAFQLRDAPEAA